MADKPPPSYRAVKRLSDDQVIELYLAGHDPDTVGWKAGIHAVTVRKILTRHNVPLRPPNRGRKSGAPVDEAEVCKRYKAGESGVALAQAYATSTARIYGILRRHEVARRNTATMLRQRHRAERQRRESGGE